jgi:rfaE bifunctional protein nucleotidyltransferase chain/domain
VAQLYSRAKLVEVRNQWRRDGKKVVFTNGCYDLIHPGHIRLLEAARSLGDVLILALNSDESIRGQKGGTRPVFSESERAEIACGIQSVDAVTIFEEDTPEELIQVVLPDVLIKGADWSHYIAGREVVEASGGQVAALPLVPGFSTTSIVEILLKLP